MADLDIEHLSARLSQDPRSPLFARLAELYLAASREREALALCEKGVGLYPEYAAGQLMLGRCYSSAGRVREARSAFHRALELAPYNAVVQNLLIALPAPAADETETFVAASGVPDDAPADVETRAPEASIDSALIEDEAPAIAPWEEPSAAEELMETEPFPLPPAFEEHPGKTFALPAETAHEDRDEDMSPLPAETTFEGSDEDMFPLPAETAFEGSDEDMFPIPAETATADEDAEPEEPAFEPFPTFEEYIAQHPVSSASMTLEEYLKGRTARSESSSSSSQQHAAAGNAPTDLESLARQLQNARRIVPSEQAPSSSIVSPDAGAQGAPRAIVTQTMAEIYAAQNEFQAAIEAYQELIKKQPEHAQVFQQRIDAIRLLTGDI